MSLHTCTRRYPPAPLVGAPGCERSSTHLWTSLDLDSGIWILVSGFWYWVLGIGAWGPKNGKRHRPELWFHIVAWAILAPCSPLLAPCWLILAPCWPILAPCWRILAPCWPISDLCWPTLMPTWPNLAPTWANMSPTWRRF